MQTPHTLSLSPLASSLSARLATPTRLLPSPFAPLRPPQIKETIEKFTETLATKQKEADEFGAKHRITAQGGNQPNAAAAADGEGGSGSQGVLI